MKRLLTFVVCVLLCMCARAQTHQQGKSHIRDSVALDNVTVTGKTKVQKLREGALSVNAIDVKSIAASLSGLNSLIDRTAGLKIREEGGMGSDFDLSINGMSGNSVRYFVDGLPLDVKGSSVTLANLPIALIDRVEIYKGVVPTYLNTDALGGAVNIVTNRRQSNYLDASYTIGSFHTHQADLNGQLVLSNGFTIRPTLGLNYSKNDYMMHDVEVWDASVRKYLPADRRRFHDGYRSLLAQVEAGFSNKPWADALFFGISYSTMNKELQTNQLQSRVIGMAERQSNSWGVSAYYRKRDLFLQHLDLNVSLSHTWDHSLTVDTAYRKYDWNGNYIRSSRNEISGRAHSLRHFKRPLTTARADANYQLAEGHLLNLSYALDRTGNNRWDEVDKSFEPANDVLAKHIISLSYNQLLFRERWSNTFFVKDYVNHLSIEQTDIPTVTHSRDVLGSNTSSYWGYGLGSRFQVGELLSVKASYERSIRLPLARELLGNGTTIYANTALQPEQSNNLNLGLFGTWRIGDDHSISYEAGGFLRFVDNYIQPQVSEKEGTMQYVNEPAVHIKGVEGELRYDWQQRLQLTGNVSWLDARDRQRYKADGKPSVTFNNHVPNRPWLFANGEARYRLPNLLAEGDRLQISIDYQWVHWFFLSWEGYGALDTKARIPEKNVVGATISYSWHHNRYSIAVDCRNLFDTTVYDNYKLQKPGRTIMAKFRVMLSGH